MKRHQSRSAIQLFILLFLFISPQLVAQTNKLERNSTVQSLFNYKTFHAIKSIEPLSQDRLKTTDRILLSSNSKFQIWGLESEQAAADTVIKVLTANYDRIADSLNTQLTNYVTVDIYPDLSTFHAAINWSSAPDWAVGAAFGETNIHMVSPYNPGPVHSFSSIINVVTHELVHCFVHNLKNGAYVPIWINEGSASYLAFQATSTNQICDYIDQHGSIPTLSELNNGSTYGNIGGYSFGYTIVEFIVTEVGGSDILSQFIASGANYSILGFANETEFQIAWQQFLGDQYPCYVNDPITSIYDIQYTTIAGDGTYPSLLVDQLVITHGIVTAINYDGYGNNFFISSQEAGPWKGIYVYNADTSPLIGDEVQLNGTIIEFYGITEIHSPTVTILTSGNTVPEPVIANTGNLINSVNAEAYEGCLVKVENITVTQNEDNLNQWYVDDGSGACQIDDEIFRYTDISLGKQYQYIIGALDYSFFEYGINPRFLSDVLVKEEQSFVEPLIQNQWTTFTWPYNAYMPEDSEGINGHVGNACGYTSIARILHYWEFPNNGIGNLQFTDAWGFSWDCDLENLNLDYSKMPNYLPFDATQAEYHETAKLFEAAGAVGEKIKVWATGFEIYLPAAFIDYFKFSPNATIVNRENYSKQEWIDIFKNELDNGRPMVIVGRTPDSPAPDEPGQITGHWWICDGYNSAGEFYVDYAFGGIKGYWDIDNLGEVYTAYNRAVIGLQPNTDIKTLELSFPNGGETIFANTEVDITWNSVNISDIKIEFSENNGSNWEDIIASTSANTQSYNWTAPEITSSQCLIKISDPTDAGLFDVSETTFTIDNTQTFISPYTPDENTVLLMHLDGDLTNSSTLSGDGTPQGGGISYSTGVFSNFDQCLELDGSTYVTIPHNENLNLTGDWTIEMWFKITSLNAGLINKPASGGWGWANYNIHVESPDGHMEARFYDTNGNRYQINTPSGTIEINKWYHVAFINNTQTNSIKLLLRDEAYATIFEQSLSYPAETIPINSNYNVTIGESVTGFIDELRISNIVRSFEYEPNKESVSSQNLEVFYDQENSTAANSIVSQLQPKIDFYKKYFKYFFTDHSKTFSINICKDLAEFNQFKPADLPNFETAYTYQDVLFLVNPTTQTQLDYFDSFEQAAMHGFAMRCVDYLYDFNAAEWMKYGFARHQSGMKSTSEEILAEVSNLGRKPTYQEMYDWEESATFDKYAFAYTMIKYISDVHSLDWLMGFIRFENNTTVYGFRQFNTEEKFNQTWHYHLDVFYLRDSNLMKFQRESDYFYFHMTDEDALELDQFEAELETFYTRFTNDMEMTIGHKIHIFFYPDMCDYQLIKGDDYCDLNNHSVGEKLGIALAKFTRINSNASMMNSIGLAQHELTHVIHGNLEFEDNPSWLVEGLATLMPGGLITEEVMNGTTGVIKEQVNVGFSELFAATGKYPTILELDSDEFINENGLDHNLVFYMLGSVIVDYTIKTSGYLAFKDFILSEGLDYTTLGFADSEDFTESFYAYFEANWKNAPQQTTADKTSENITIDGIINEADWDLDQEVSGIYPFSQSWKNNEVKFGVLWDDDYLYVAVEVLDSKLIDNSNFDWNDGIAIYIDGDFNKGIHYDTYDRQFIKRWNNAALEEKNNLTEGVQHAVKNIEGGYAVEFAIPWTNLGITQVANTTIGFDISNLDEDCSETYNCRYQLIWSGNDYNPDITINFGELTLVSTLVPNFTVDITSGFNPLTVNFTDLSTGNPTTWEWDFDNDGTSDSNVKNPEWTFDNPGTYTVSLTISDGVNTESITKTDYISVNTPLEPVADFSSNYTSGLAPLSVDFTDQTTQGSESLTQWNWNFGDGSTSELQNPSHTFSEAGVYTVSLTVQDNYGLSDTKIKTNFITAYILPEEPSIPQPENQATDVSIDTDLSWTIDSNTENIDLYFGTENPPTTKVLDNVAAITTYSLTSLDYQTSYFWKIVCRSSFGSTEGPIWEFTTDIATGISDNPSDDKLISIYPNPASEKILISVPVLVDLSILDIYGKIVYEIKDFQQGEINISVFNKGIYFVVFTSKKGRVSRKIIIE